uniref:Uncharacterized protein n=1 Tax=Solanum lycopersicum TaxID=4081 RepID=K4BRM1_SOLLC
MAKRKETSTTEIDDRSSMPSNQISNPKFSVNLLQLLKSTRMQHGLRFGDYARYRCVISLHTYECLIRILKQTLFLKYKLQV